MAPRSTRITTLAVVGGLLVAAAIVARIQIGASRGSTPKSTQRLEMSPADRAAAEQELARLYSASKEAPNDKQKHWDLVNFYLKHNILNKAAVHLAVIVHLDPSDLQAQLKLADVSLAARQYPAAENFYRGAIKADPRNTAAWRGLASALIRERRFFEAVNTAEHAVELDPASPEAHLVSATALVQYALQFPDPLSHADYLERARRQLADLANTSPDNGEVFYQYGWALIALQHRKEAVAQLERAVKMLPDDGEATRTLAMTYRSLNENDLALKVVTDFNARAPDDPATNDVLGQLLIDSTAPGSIQKAVDAFKKAAAAAPNDPSILERLGEAYEKANDQASARTVFERLAKINPNRSFAFNRLSLIYTRVGEQKLAVQAAETAERNARKEQQLKTMQDLSANHPKDIDLHLKLAGRLLALKQVDQAGDEYYQVLRLDPGNTHVPARYRAAASPHQAGK